MEKLIQNILPDDLDENMDLKHLLELVGIDAVRQIIKDFGGTSIYIPQPKSLNTVVKRVVINEIQKGKTVKQIAKEIGVSVQKVYNVIRNR